MSDSLLVVVTFILLSFIPLFPLGHYFRKRRRHQKNATRKYGVIQRLGEEKGLNQTELGAAQRMARAARIPATTKLLRSVRVFDRGMASWMSRVQQMSWLEIDREVEVLRALREKLGFRYLPPEEPPSSTRELELDQSLYFLARGNKGLRVLSAPVVDLDDLAIRTEAFREGGRPVRFPKGHEMWLFFWPESGGECRFKSKVLKEVARPMPYLVLNHGDGVIINRAKEFFTCDLDVELIAERVPASKVGGVQPSQILFQKGQHIESLPVRLIQLSGSGFVVSKDAGVGLGDIIRLSCNVESMSFLDELVGIAEKEVGSGVRFRFVKLATGEREEILDYITPRVKATTTSRGRMARLAPDR